MRSCICLSGSPVSLDRYGNLRCVQAANEGGGRRWLRVSDNTQFQTVVRELMTYTPIATIAGFPQMPSTGVRSEQAVYCSCRPWTQGSVPWCASQGLLLTKSGSIVRSPSYLSLSASFLRPSPEAKDGLGVPDPFVPQGFADLEFHSFRIQHNQAQCLLIIKASPISPDSAKRTGSDRSPAPQPRDRNRSSAESTVLGKPVTPQHRS